MVKRVPDEIVSAVLEYHELVRSYGSFMVTWSIFEELLECVIWRETKMTATHAIIVVSGLGFERKASIARSLLALHGVRYAEAVSLINQITQDAERNALVHGLQQVALPGIRFLKRSTDQKLKIVSRYFDAPELDAKDQSLLKKVGRLQAAAQITERRLKSYEKTTASLASNAATSSKPPSS